jgi:flavin-dependent dehydrogenase
MSAKNNRSKLAIAGAGVAGAYLYKLLSKDWARIDIYDVRHNTKCEVSPCAWVTSKGFIEHVEASGLDPKKYILQEIKNVAVDDLKVRVNVMTIDKPSFVKDLLQGADVKYTPLDINKYDKVIDATGLSRTFLPPVKEDILSSCIQYCVQSREEIEPRVEPTKIGYAWCFHLTNNRYHIGCGSLTENPSHILKELGWHDKYQLNPGRNILCGCAGKIRITGPHHSEPFVSEGLSEGIWGVGESIGCVGSVVGDGIVPGMRSAQILLKNWDNPDSYRDSILREFSWIHNERKLVDKLRNMAPLNMGDAWVLKNNSKRIGMNVGLTEAAIYVKRLKNA